MADLSGIVKQLKKERDRVEQQLSRLNAALAAFAGVYRGMAKPKSKRRKMVREVLSEDRSRTESMLGEGQSKAKELGTPLVLISFACKILHPEVLQPWVSRSISVILFLLVGAVPAQRNPDPRLAAGARLAALTQDDFRTLLSQTVILFSSVFDVTESSRQCSGVRESAYANMLETCMDIG